LDLILVAFNVWPIEFAAVFTAWAFEIEVTIFIVVIKWHGEGRFVARAVIIVLVAIKLAARVVTNVVVVIVSFVIVDVPVALHFLVALVVVAVKGVIDSIIIAKAITSGDHAAILLVLVSMESTVHRDNVIGALD
jgi:hypothetical protein